MGGLVGGFLGLLLILTEDRKTIPWRRLKTIAGIATAIAICAAVGSNITSSRYSDTSTWSIEYELTYYQPVIQQVYESNAMSEFRKFCGEDLKCKTALRYLEDQLQKQIDNNRD